MSDFRFIKEEMIKEEPLLGKAKNTTQSTIAVKCLLNIPTLKSSHVMPRDTNNV